MTHLVDRLSTLLGHISAWLFFATGMMITYEVTARYLFDAPTIWAAEISLLFLLWGSFLAMATILRQRQHIRITIVLNLLGRRGRMLADAASLLVIAAFSAVVTWYGFAIAWDSLTRGRSTGTMLNIPNWWAEMVIPAGFAILLLQCLVELAKLATGQSPPTPHDSELLQ